MRNKDIENMLKAEADSFTPYVLPEILKRQKYSILEPEDDKRQRRTIYSKRMALALSFMVILLIGISTFMGIMLQDYETIYLEINPAMELTTNRFGYIKNINYLNEDAYDLLSGNSLKWTKLDNAIEIIIDLCYDKGYLNEDSIVYVSTSSYNSDSADKTNNRLREIINNRLRHNNIEPEIISDDNQDIDEETRRDAENASIPPAKMLLINQIISKDDNYTVEGLKHKSIKELREILKSVDN